VLIARKWGAPIVCNDGVTIAKELELKDPEEDLGARMIREAAERTGDSVGDGTSTSAILAHAIYADGVRNVEAGASAIDLKRGLDRGVRAAVAAIQRMSRPITSLKEKAQIATTSAHNDETIGKLVADAVEKVGAEGVVSLEDAKGTETALEVVEGMSFDRGFLSPYFVTDAARMECALDKPLILLHEAKLTAMQPLLPLLEQVAQGGRPLLIIADDVEAEALATLIVNRVRGTLSSVAVKAPGFGDRRKEILADIAVLTGGKVVSAELGQKLENVKLDHLGSTTAVTGPLMMIAWRPRNASDPGSSRTASRESPSPTACLARLRSVLRKALRPAAAFDSAGASIEQRRATRLGRIANILVIHGAALSVGLWLGVASAEDSNAVIGCVCRNGGGRTGPTGVAYVEGSRAGSVARARSRLARRQATRPPTSVVPRAARAFRHARRCTPCGRYRCCGAASAMVRRACDQRATESRP